MFTTEFMKVLEELDGINETTTTKKSLKESYEDDIVKAAIKKLEPMFPDLNFIIDKNLSLNNALGINCDTVVKVTSKSGKAMGYGFNSDFMTDDDNYGGPDLANDAARACYKFMLDPDIRAEAIDLETLLDDEDATNDTLLMTLYMLIYY